MLLVILIVLAVLCFHQRHLAKHISAQNASLKEMTNGLIVSIPIGHYDNPPDAEVSGFFPNLPVERDAKNMKSLADFLKYTYMTSEGKLSWTESEVMDFMRNKVGQEFFNVEGAANYDGLIVSVSGHGVRDHIVTSDGKLIERTSIHRCISNEYPKIREFPRIFLFDACDGAGDRKATIPVMQRVESDSDDEEKGDLPKTAEFVKNTELEDVQKNNEWTRTSKNPDYNLISIHASNPGFVAKMNNSEEVGSYLTYFFVKYLKRYIEGGNNGGLGAIMDKIEKTLHDSGKQQIRTEFFTQTRNLRIEKNVFA